ncbi:unnamed protein product [Orchesella dallaii]|uniref:F-box domain-containing protein n=1 Tax=Orchesella dallaii TaxID=48710 RepID=A0ABP1RGU7_9HEXA
MEEEIQTMDDLPLEVIEKIVDKLKLGETDVDDDRKTMFNIRLVNSRWKAAMENVLEQKCLASWTKWKVVRYTNLLPQLFKWVRMYGSAHIAIPQSLETIGGNPFITKSMYTDDSRDHEEAGWKIIPSQKFFTEWGHGQTITSFKTHNSHPPKEMYEILCLLPNLKALGVPIDIQKDEEIFMKNQALPPLPSLKILELFNPKPENQYRDYFRWFLNAYAGHIVHLKLASENSVALRNTKKISAKSDSDSKNSHKMYGNLRRLKVYMPGGTFFKKTEANIPLTHLSIEHYEKPVSMKGLKVIVDFICKFEKTLVKLHVDVELGDAIALSGEQVPAPPEAIFLKLTDFAYNLPLPVHERMLFKRWFIQRYPELKYLQFVRHHDNIAAVMVRLGFGYNPDETRESELERYFGSEGYWLGSPKLEKISLRTCQENGDQELVEVMRPQPPFRWPS